MSSFFNKVFGDSGEGDKKPESHLPRRNEGPIDSPFQAAPPNPSADMGHQLFGQLAEAEAPKSSEPVSPFTSARDEGSHPQGFVRPGKLPVRGFTAGELASLLPPEFINHRSMPVSQEVDLDLTRARQSIASGRPAVMLSDIYAACPRLFARHITADQDFEVRLPLKRVEALIGMSDGVHAGGPFSPFQMSSGSSYYAPVASQALSEQSPFRQAAASQAPPASPFEIVGSLASEPVSPQQHSVPLFTQTAPPPSEPAPTPVSRPAAEEKLPNDYHYTADVPPAQSAPQNLSGGLVELQLGKALRYVSVDVLGFSAKNVPESVISKIPSSAIAQRNPNGSSTVPLSVLVDGLEPVYRSAFNQAVLAADVTIPVDVLPSAPPISAESSPVSIESPFAAFAREDAEKHGATAREVLPTEKSLEANKEQSSGDSAAEHGQRAMSEDTRALQDLSKRLSAFREHAHVSKAAETPVSAEQVKPLVPLSGLPAASVADPQPKFRDLQEETDLLDGSEESFILSTPEHKSAPHASAVYTNTALDEVDDWKQVELKAVFGFEKTLSTRGVFDLISQLADVRSAAFIQGNETKLSTDGFGEAAPMLSGLIQSVRLLSSEIGIQGAQSFALQTNRGALAFFSEGNGTIAVMAKGDDISRASKQRIIVILRELVRGA